MRELFVLGVERLHVRLEWNVAGGNRERGFRASRDVAFHGAHRSRGRLGEHRRRRRERTREARERLRRSRVRRHERRHLTRVPLLLLAPFFLRILHRAAKLFDLAHLLRENRLVAL